MNFYIEFLFFNHFYIEFHFFFNFFFYWIFYWIFSPDISLCHILIFTNCIICVFISHDSISIKIKILWYNETVDDNIFAFPPSGRLALSWWITGCYSHNSKLFSWIEHSVAVNRIYVNKRKVIHMRWIPFACAEYVNESAVKCLNGVRSARCRSQLAASRMSGHADELWYNETVCLWMIIHIYMCVCVCVCVCVFTQILRHEQNIRQGWFLIEAYNRFVFRVFKPLDCGFSMFQRQIRV